MVARGFLILYVAASASWLMSLFASPVLGVLVSAVATWGFLRVAQGFDRWSRQGGHVSYSLASVASRGAAAAVVVFVFIAALLLTRPAETWGVRLALYAVWSGLWILYYCALHARLEELGVEDPPSRYPMTYAALGLNALLSPLLTEGLPAPPEAKLALAASAYAGFMPPFNTSALLAALLARR